MIYFNLCSLQKMTIRRKTNKRKYRINYTNSSNIINNNEYYHQFRWFVFFLRVARRVFMNSLYSECNFLNFSRESGNENRCIEKFWIQIRIFQFREVTRKRKKMILGHIYRPINFTCILISHNSLIYEWYNYNYIFIERKYFKRFIQFLIDKILL